MDSKFILIFWLQCQTQMFHFQSGGETNRKKKKEQRGELVNGDSGDRAAPPLQSTR